MRSVLAALLVLFVATAAFAADATQAPKTSPAPAQPAPAPAQPVPAAPDSKAEPQSAVPYSYNADGRRDPFQSLATASADPKGNPKPTAAGIAGIRIDELAVRGIMQSRERLVAMVQGADNRTYLIHQGDKLADGVVKTITPQGVVLVQDVNDPHAHDKTREVRKLLRSLEDEKE